jgi:hypothetical protein
LGKRLFAEGYMVSDERYRFVSFLSIKNSMPWMAGSKRRYLHWNHEPTANWGAEEKLIRRLVAELKTGGIE